ncbi:MAG: formylglycine-generating enzyme family protein [Candidatus Sumerlaeia bacterium]|nr:formylglycine-generating enzyme family protein [Candidatus Sumerlaeia bacterium]
MKFPRFSPLMLPLVAMLALGAPAFAETSEEPEEQQTPEPGEQRRIDIGSGVHVMLVWIPPGEFVMGSPESEEGRYDRESPQTTVIHSKGFWMSDTPITQAQYSILMDANPSKSRGLSYPVEGVSFQDALEFCEVISRHASVYATLPTEAQWEYAARAGTTTPFHFGDTIHTSQANFHGVFPYGESEKGTFRGSPSSVRIFPANDFGLYDMHGNVHEWCLDHYREYPGGEQVDWFQHVPNAEKTRVIRGGSWQNRPEFIRSAARLFSPEFSRSASLGFRIVVTDHEPLHRPDRPMTVEELWESKRPVPR